MTLNLEQQQAVQHLEGPLLVLAGAGSGKTKIVTERICYLLRLGVPASEIVAVTFTNKAAEEMKSRVLQASQTSVLTSTFHSLSARILRESITSLGYQRDFLILDEEDCEKLLKQCLIAMDIKEDKQFLKTVRRAISTAKNDLCAPEDFKEDREGIKGIYTLYQSKLKASNSVDFDDLLFLTVKLFEQHPDILASYQKRWSFLLIDEYQDTNLPQYLLIKYLAGDRLNVFAVGDPDQSIYSWRGADIQNILRFEKDYPGAKIVRLEQNYRSCNTILSAANALISHNESRLEKNLWSTRGEGEKITLYLAANERQEADFVTWKIKAYKERGTLTYRDSAILYRTNFQSRTFEDALLREKIPYKIIGGLSFYQRKEIKDLISFLRLILSDFDDLAFMRAIYLPKRGLGPSSLDKLKTLSQEKNLGLFALCKLVSLGRVEAKLSAKQLQGLTQFIDLIESLRVMYSLKKPLSEILSETLSRSRYLEVLEEDPETRGEKKENLEELIAKAAEWETEVETPSLSTFLEEIALKSSTEEPSTENQEVVKLMTLHSGKGLEFPLVFLVGLEEDLFPHINAKDSPSLLEEERRLCYVGMTRAKDLLYLTASHSRFLWGTSRPMRQSRFLREIPKTYLRSSQIEEDAPSSSASFEIGDRVVHRDFGEGLVQKAYQTSLGATYDVYFERDRKMKSLVAQYAKLKKC